MDNRPRAHVCSRWPHHRRRRRHPTQRHRPDAGGRLFHLCHAACRYSLQIAYLTGRTTADEATISRSPPSMRYGAPLPSDARCDFYIRTDAVSKRAYRLRLRHVRARGRGVLLRPRQCHQRHQDIPLRPYRSRLASFEGLHHPVDFNLNDYLFFEFDFADRPPVAATFSFAPQTQIDMINGLTRGEVSSHTPMRDGSRTVEVRALKPPLHFAWPTPWTA